jgi:hypothetical protein
MRTRTRVFRPMPDPLKTEWMDVGRTFQADKETRSGVCDGLVVEVVNDFLSTLEPADVYSISHHALRESGDLWVYVYYRAVA